MFRLLAACALAAGLAGCVSPQQQMAADDTACRQMGARPGSDVYVQCRMFREQQRGQEERQRQANSAALLAYGSQMLSGPQSVQMNCTSVRTGNFTNTNCY